MIVDIVKAVVTLLVYKRVSGKVVTSSRGNVFLFLDCCSN